MRIMHIAPADFEGPARLSDGIDDRHIIHVGLQPSRPNRSNLYPITKQGAQVMVHGLKKIADQSYDTKLRKTFEAVFKQYRPDIVHVHAVSGMSLLPILNTASNLKIKKILGLYDYSLVSAARISAKSLKPPVRQRKMYYTRIKHIINQCDAIVCHKPQQKKLLERLHGTNPKIIPLENSQHPLPAIYDSVLKRKTRSLFLKVGHLCNSKCLYCVAGVANESFIDLTRLKKKLEEIAPDYDRVVLTGGEPTMHPRFFDLLAVIFYLGLQIEIQSNIRIFSGPRIASRIKKFNPKIVVCINSSREDVFDLLADAPGAFKQTVRGAENLIKEGIAVETKIIITRQNADHLTEITDFIKGLGIRSVMLVFPTPMGLAQKNFAKINPRYIDILSPVHESLQRGIDHGMQMLTENIPYCLLGEKYHDYNTQCEGMLDGIYMNISRGLYNCKAERMDIQKMKLPACQTCRYSYKCEGIYREYVKNFGGAEFVPSLA